ncbi:MAG: hypothetical protein ACTSW1_12345 [Candidatus Hodarchaeales archaeon]
MTTTVQFAWNRMEGIGLILVSLGISLLVQLPLAFFALVYLHFDLNTSFVAMFGTLIGTGTILTTLSCSMAEDWDERNSPSFKRVSSFSTLFAFLLYFGFFVFFILLPFFPEELSSLTAEQQYFSAIALGLIMTALTTYLIYKGKTIFR